MYAFLSWLGELWQLKFAWHLFVGCGGFGGRMIVPFDLAYV
jgi:hypothetical protein